MPEVLRDPPSFSLAEDSFDELHRLRTNQLREVFFGTRPELACRAVVEALASRATSLLRVDPRDAEALIETSMWLSEKLNDDFARGKAHRARANLAHIKGNESEALSHYDAARALFWHTGADLEAAITASSSLQTLVFLGQHERAVEDADFARGVFHATGDRLRLARLNSNFATLLYHRDRWAEAAAHYEAAYRDFLEVGEKQDVAVCLSNMAVCHLQQQDFVQALDFYKRTRSYCEQNGLAALTADLDYNIAYLHYLRGQYTTALELYRETRNRHSELGDKHHVDLCALNEAEIYLELNLIGECLDLASAAYSGFSDRGLTLESAKALTILAIANSRQGKAFFALELLTQAQELFHKENSDKWVALADLYRATIFSRAGRPFESRRLAARADVTFQKYALIGKSIACRVLLGRLALADRAYESAEALCRESIQALAEIDAPALLFQASFLLGDIKRALGEDAAAVAAYIDAHAQLARMTGAIQTEEQRIQALDDKLVIYEKLVAALVDVGQVAQAFGFIENAKSRSLTDLLAFRAYALPEKQPGRSKLADQVRQLREELNWYYRQIDLQEMKTEELPTKEVEALRRYSRQQETRLIRTLNLLQQSDKEFSSVQEAFSADLPAIRSTLSAGTTMLEYYIANGEVLAVVLDQDKLEIIPTTLASTVDELRSLLASSLSRRRTAGTDRGNDVLRHLSKLYQELVEPIATSLSGTRLVIVPHGSLFYLPFHAFRVNDTFLSEQFSISYSPSATAFHLARVLPRRRGQTNRLAVVAPTNDDASSRLANALVATIPSSRRIEGARRDGNFSSRAAGWQMVHAVTKAHLRQDNPMFSTILLGDERIHLFDLFQMKVDLDLIALSGCAPGLEASAKGNEVVGLSRGLLYAGTRSVLTTLWDVDDATWIEFSEHFYGSMGTGASIQMSLRVATEHLRNRTNDLVQWAPFLLFGDTD